MIKLHVYLLHLSGYLACLLGSLCPDLLLGCMDVLLRIATEFWQPKRSSLIVHFVACWMLKGQGKIDMKALFVFYSFQLLL